jgi:hypothetical protein
MPPKVELQIDENELPVPAGQPGAPARKVRRPVAVVPGTLLVRDADADAVRGDVAALEGFTVLAREPIGAGWSLVRFAAANVPQAQALERALTRLNAPAPGRAPGGRRPRSFANRIVGCPRLMGGGLPAAPDPANSPADGPLLGQGPGAGVTVAVLDTVPMHHPGLVAQVEGMPAAAPPIAGDTSTSATGHCLLVAGIVLRVAPAAKVRLVGVLGNDGSGSDAQLAAALNALAHDVDLVNLSLCTPASRLPAVADAVAALQARGVGVIAAAGNANPDEWDLTHEMLPAALPNVVGVGSVSGEGATAALSTFSQRGPWVRALSQGEHRFGAFVTGTQEYGDAQHLVEREFRGWCHWDGTSFAAPAVAGAAAALLSQHPELTGAQALAQLVDAPTIQTLAGTPLVDPVELWPIQDPGPLELSPING